MSEQINSARLKQWVNTTLHWAQQKGSRVVLNGNTVIQAANTMNTNSPPSIDFYTTTKERIVKRTVSWETAQERLVVAFNKPSTSVVIRGDKVPGTIHLRATALLLDEEKEDPNPRA